MPMLIRTAFAAALVCAATLAPADAQYSSRDAACRYKVAQATRNYTTMLVERGLLCHKQRAGRHLESYYNARTYMQQKCQLKKDKGYAGWTSVPDCGDLDDPAHPFFGRNLAFRARRDAVLTARCDGVDVAGATGTCGSDPASLAACASAAAEQCSNVLFPQVFP